MSTKTCPTFTERMDLSVTLRFACGEAIGDLFLYVGKERTTAANPGRLSAGDRCLLRKGLTTWNGHVTECAKWLLKQYVDRAQFDLPEVPLGGWFGRLTRHLFGAAVKGQQTLPDMPEPETMADVVMSRLASTLVFTPCKTRGPNGAVTNVMWMMLQNPRMYRPSMSGWVDVHGNPMDVSDVVSWVLVSPMGQPKALRDAWRTHLLDYKVIQALPQWDLVTDGFSGDFNKALAAHKAQQKPVRKPHKK